MRPALSQLERIPMLQSAEAATSLNLAGRIVAGALEYTSTIGTITAFNLAHDPAARGLGPILPFLDAIFQDLMMRGGRFLAGLRRLVSAPRELPAPARLPISFSDINSETIRAINRISRAFISDAHANSENGPIEGPLLAALDSPSFQEKAAALIALRTLYLRTSSEAGREALASRAAEALSSPDGNLRDYAIGFFTQLFTALPREQRPRYFGILLEQYSELSRPESGAKSNHLAENLIRNLNQIFQREGFPEEHRASLARDFIARTGGQDIRFEIPLLRLFAAEPSHQVETALDILRNAGDFSAVHDFMRFGNPELRQAVADFVAGFFNSPDPWRRQSSFHRISFHLSYLTPDQTRSLAIRAIDGLRYADQETLTEALDLLGHSLRALGSREALPLVHQMAGFLDDPRPLVAEFVAYQLNLFFGETMEASLASVAPVQGGREIASFHDLWRGMIQDLSSPDLRIRRQGLNLIRASLHTVARSGQDLSRIMELSLLTSPYEDVNIGVQDLLARMVELKERGLE